MKLLAIDSSGLTASVAILQDGILLAEYSVNYKKTHSQTLLPMLDTAASMVDLDLKTIDAIAVAEGPGSFTGLRIGSATAKGLGLALDKPLVAVPTLEGLAYNLYGARGLVCPMMDARRSQVYTGIYRFERGGLQVVWSQRAVAVQELAQELNRLGEEVILLGDGATAYGDQMADLLQVPYQEAPPHMNRQRAAALGALAMQMYARGQIQTAALHRPEYLRLSQAERERMERLQEKQESKSAGGAVGQERDQSDGAAARR